MELEKVINAQLNKEELSELIDSSKNILMNTDKYQQIDIPLKEYFSHDCYAREVRIPKGATVLGKVHKYENLNILSQGEILVCDIDGARKLTAPCTFVSSAGVQRLVAALTDVVWTTIHGTKLKDAAEIEKEYVCSSIEEFKQLTNTKTIPSKIEG